MTHVRQQIRDRVATALNLIGPTIYKFRSYALDDDALPAICVYTDDETSSLATIGARTLRRQLDVVVETLLIGPSTTVQDTADNYCASIERALGFEYEAGKDDPAIYSGDSDDDPSLALLFGSLDEIGVTVKDFILNKTSVAINVDGGKAVCVATMRYSCVYYTAIQAPEDAR